ncbi:MAG: bifunctional phosphoribosyl-AMP cyclohydrolase/phosphoribosyl-ATP diphosphatase HisIE [Candidatus Heimdallarchaeota archaeon]|nr:bifunctional phosphoribosyl-AMP cyclohydrolase/phosphoribosyl-ATP diphosphatase HisIE [Candidatus Heimdallarchaeota archaeon]
MEFNEHQIEAIVSKIDFTKENGLVPAIIQDSLTKQVLMLGFMNEEALGITLKTKKVCFWSRSKKKLWQKGETSGNIAIVKDLSIDCDSDTILFQVETTGPICHTGKNSCFDSGERQDLLMNASILEYVFQIIKERIETYHVNSYVSKMNEKGTEAIQRKIGEEAIELILSVATNESSEIIHEATDLLFHVMLLLGHMSLPLQAIYEELMKRHQKKVLMENENVRIVSEKKEV